MWGGQDVRQSVCKAHAQNFKPCSLINSNASVKHGENEETMADNRKKTVSFKESSNETSMVLTHNCKIDKFIVFWLAQGKSPPPLGSAYGTAPGI